ncbi:hypothetical protein FB446DRAFT_14287 [Lentinula raphanica]|nr:hypothetical protein FB446DRAFT_14287 [Lentinula raphanica]
MVLTRFHPHDLRPTSLYQLLQAVQIVYKSTRGGPWSFEFSWSNPPRPSKIVLVSSSQFSTMLRVSTTVLITISLLSVIVQPVVAAPVNNNLLPRKDNHLFSREYPGMSPPPFEPGQGQSGATSKLTNTANLVTAGTDMTTALMKFGKETGASNAIKEEWDKTKGEYRDMKLSAVQKKNDFEAKIPGTEAHNVRQEERKAEKAEEKAQKKALENGDCKINPYFMTVYSVLSLISGFFRITSDPH